MASLSPVTKNHAKWPLLSAVALFVGTIVGAGIFALPAAFVRAGFLPGVLLFVLVGGISYVLHLMYAEVVLRMQDGKQFAGIAERCFGRFGQTAAAVMALAGGYGAMLAYLIGIGAFLSLLLKDALPFSASFYSVVFAVLGFFAVAVGLSAVVVVQRIMLAVLLLVLLIFLIVGIPHVQWSSFFAGTGTWNGLFSFYGVLLFSFMGTGALVDMEQVLVHDKRRMLPAIRVGFLIAAVVYALFIFVVVGVSGTQTSAQAISGLAPVIGNWILVLGALFGIASMSTSFLSSGLQLHELFDFDLKLPRVLAAFLACAPPLVFFLLGLEDFGRAIELTGSIAVGGTVLLILAMHARASQMIGDHPPFVVKMPRVLRWVLYLLLFAAMLYGIVPSVVDRIISMY